MNNRHTGNIIWQSENQKIINCQECEYAHILPYPNLDDIKNFYKDTFYQSHWENYVDSHLTDFEWQMSMHNDKYEIFENYLPNTDRRILDLGSGPGTFLRCGQKRGWECIGIEPSKSAAKFSSEKFDLKIINDFFHEDNYDNFGTFDVIHLNNVIEHILNPKQLILMLSKILKKNGLLCISAPNDFNRLQTTYQKVTDSKIWWVAPNEHINYFNKSTLTKLMENNNINIIDSFSSFPLEFFLLMGKDYIDDNETGKSIHEMRKKFDLFLSNYEKELKINFYRKIAELEIGRIITVIGRKD